MEILFNVNAQVSLVYLEKKNKLNLYPNHQYIGSVAHDDVPPWSKNDMLLGLYLKRLDKILKISFHSYPF